MKTYTLYFEGQIEIEMENETEATDYLPNLITPENVTYYRMTETDPNTTAELRVVEEYP